MHGFSVLRGIRDSQQSALIFWRNAAVPGYNGGGRVPARAAAPRR